MFISTVAIRSNAVGMASMKISWACCLRETSSCSTTRFARRLKSCCKVMCCCTAYKLLLSVLADALAEGRCCLL